jgi:hypothetical protein
VGWKKCPDPCGGDCAPDTEPPDTDQNAPSPRPSYWDLWEVREALRAFLYDPDGKSTPAHLSKLRRLVPLHDPPHWRKERP